MKKITVHYLEDHTDCETCGPSYADGAHIMIEDHGEIDLSPCAHCYHGTTYSDQEIFIKILNKLGYEVTVE